MGRKILYYKNDFSAGMLNKNLTNRTDLTKYYQSYAFSKNFMPQVDGVLAKRNGTVYCGDLPGPAHLIPFRFNNSQSYVLIFGENWLRIGERDGQIANPDGTPYQIKSPYSLRQAKEISFVQSRDVLFLVQKEVPPQKLKRLGWNDWQFEPLPLSQTLLSPPPPPSVIYTIRGDDDEKKNFPNVVKYSYFVSVKNKDGLEGKMSGGSSVTAPLTTNWSPKGDVTISWSAVQGAKRYRIYKAISDGRPGLIGETEALHFIDTNIAPAYTIPRPLGESILDWKDGEFPGVVGIFEQRLIFAGTKSQPNGIWASATGEYDNFQKYEPEKADSAVKLSIASQTVSGVKWIVATNGILLGTEDGEWKITGYGGRPFSATTASLQQFGATGSSAFSIIKHANFLLFLAYGNSAVLSLDTSGDDASVEDISLLVSDFFRKNKMLSICMKTRQTPTLFAVLDTGGFATMSFLPQQKIVAWAFHETNGEILSCQTAENKNETNVFFVVKRKNGFFLERLAEDEENIFLDCAATKKVIKTANGKELQGLHHLNGQTVKVASENTLLHTDTTVKNGIFFLLGDVDSVVIGLPYSAQIKTNPIEFYSEEFSSKGREKQLANVQVGLQGSDCEIACIQEYGKKQVGKSQLLREQKNGISSAVLPFSTSIEIAFQITVESAKRAEINSIRSEVEIL